MQQLRNRRCGGQNFSNRDGYPKKEPNLTLATTVVHKEVSWKPCTKKQIRACILHPKTTMCYNVTRS